MSAKRQLPSGWADVALGEAFDMQLGKMLSKEASAGVNQAPYLANRHVQWDRVVLDNLDTMSFTQAEREKFALIPGDLLVCEGGEVGRTAIWHGEQGNVYFQKAIHRLRPKTDAVMPGYMLRYMRFAAERGLFTDLSSQTSIAHLTQEKLALLPIRLPTPIEQRSIAEILDTLDETIRKTEQLITKLKLAKQGLLHDLLTRGIDENGELRDPERNPGEFKESVLGRIPKLWQVHRLAELTTKIVDGVHHTPTYVPEGIRFLTVENLTRSSSISFDPCRYISKTAHVEYYRRADPRSGDVLVSKDGTLGIARVVPNDLPDFSIFVSVALLRPRCEIISPELIRLFFDTNWFQAQLGRRSAGTGLKHIHLEHFREFVLPTPPVSEQQRILGALGVADKQINLEERAANKLHLLKTALMEDLLTGRVRTTHLNGGEDT